MRLNFSDLSLTGRLLAFVVGIVLINCTSLQRTVDEVASVPVTDRPFVTSFICPQDSILQVRIAKTLPALGELSSNELRTPYYAGAKVTLNDGQQSVSLTQNPKTFVYETKPNSFSVKAGGTYRLRIELRDASIIDSQCTIPAQTVAPQSISVLSGTDPAQLRFTWPDLISGPNYYACYFYTYTFLSDGAPSTTGDRIREVFSDQVDVTNGLFVTKLIDATSYGNERNVFLICHVDKLYYDYQRAVNTLVSTRDNPFADSVWLPSNMTGAYGVFCGYTRTAVSLRRR